MLFLDYFLHLGESDFPEVLYTSWEQQTQKIDQQGME
jgi:hypothetical protein